MINAKPLGRVSPLQYSRCGPPAEVSPGDGAFHPPASRKDRDDRPVRHADEEDADHRFGSPPPFPGASSSFPNRKRTFMAVSAAGTPVVDSEDEAHHAVHRLHGPNTNNPSNNPSNNPTHGPAPPAKPEKYSDAVLLASVSDIHHDGPPPTSKPTARPPGPPKTNTPRRSNVHVRPFPSHPKPYQAHPPDLPTDHPSAHPSTHPSAHPSAHPNKRPKYSPADPPSQPPSDPHSAKYPGAAARQSTPQVTPDSRRPPARHADPANKPPEDKAPSSKKYPSKDYPGKGPEEEGHPHHRGPPGWPQDPAYPPHPSYSGPYPYPPYPQGSPTGSSLPSYYSRPYPEPPAGHPSASPPQGPRDWKPPSSRSDGPDPYLPPDASYPPHPYPYERGGPWYDRERPPAEREYMDREPERPDDSRRSSTHPHYRPSAPSSMEEHPRPGHTHQRMPPPRSHVVPSEEDEARREKSEPYGEGPPAPSSYYGYHYGEGRSHYMYPPQPEGGPWSTQPPSDHPDGPYRHDPRYAPPREPGHSYYPHPSDPSDPRDLHHETFRVSMDESSPSRHQPPGPYPPLSTPPRGSPGRYHPYPPHSHERDDYYEQSHQGAYPPYHGYPPESGAPPHYAHPYAPPTSHDPYQPHPHDPHYRRGEYSTPPPNEHYREPPPPIHSTHKGSRDWDAHGEEARNDHNLGPAVSHESDNSQPTRPLQFRRGGRNVNSEPVILRKKFSWRNYPELEEYLIANRTDYLRHSALNYTAEQKHFNNRLTEGLLELAAKHNYIFDESVFNFVAVRDRIRCYYKSYVQSSKKRGVVVGFPKVNHRTGATNESKSSESETIVKEETS